MKARFLTDFERQKLLRAKMMLPKKKPGTFKIPDEYLSMEKRTVKDGNRGTYERLRRDKVLARRIQRQSLDVSDRRLMNRDASTLTMQ